MITKLDYPGRSLLGDKPESHTEENLKIENPVDFHDVQRGPNQAGSGTDKGNPASIVPEVITSGQPCQPSGNSRLRLMKKQQRGLSIKFQSIGYKPPHLRVEGKKGNIGAGVTISWKSRGPGMPPAPSQTSGPAFRIKALICRPNRRESETKKERKREKLRDHFSPGPLYSCRGYRLTLRHLGHYPGFK